MNLKKVMKNEMVLYVLVFLAFANVTSFLSNGDYESVILFAALSVLTSHFTKNNAIVLLVALLVTQLMRRRVREGMEHGDEGDEDGDDAGVEDGDDAVDEDDEEPKKKKSGLKILKRERRHR